MQAKYWWKLAYMADAKGIIAGLAAHSGQISVGLSQGFSAVLVPKLLDSNFASMSEASWIASLGVISNPLGAFLAGATAECFGRRAAIALATLPQAAGWLLIALATNVPLLYTGRFISGLGAGMANAIYLYVTEAAAPHQRAWLASSGPILVSLGVLASYALGALTTWQRSAAISIGPAILSLALIRLLPESPAWLVRRGRLDEAKQVLVSLRGPGAACDHEYKELCSSSSVQRVDCSQTTKEVVQSLLHPNVWKPFLILLVFFALQQLCGIYVIVFYAINVLEDIGASMDEYAGSVAIGVVRLAASILGAGLANHFGRKTMACSSALGMAVSAAGVGVSMRLDIPSWMPLLCIALHVGFSMLGYLTLPWVMTSELYPLRFRGAVGGLTTAIAQILIFATIKTYPHISANVGLEATMYGFAVCGVLGALFAAFILPETRGKSLDEIEKKFSINRDEFSGGKVFVERFASISEEKGHVSKAYDNPTVDLSDENRSNTLDANCILKISTLEHECL